MKPERRHELATNELADWIVHFPQWFKENQTTVIVAAIIVIGLVAYTIFFYSRQGDVEGQKQAISTALLEQLSWQKEGIQEGRMQESGVSDAFLGIAGNLQSTSEETDNPLLSALAMIKRAEALRTELHYRPKPAEPDVIKYQLEQAKSIYEQAIEKAKGSPDISAMAEYGMALCLEDGGDFDGARKLYEKIAGSAEYRGSSFVERAKLRAQVLSDYQEKVVFAQAPPKPQAEQVEQQGQQNVFKQAPSADINEIVEKGPDINLPAQ